MRECYSLLLSTSHHFDQLSKTELATTITRTYEIYVSKRFAQCRNFFFNSAFVYFLFLFHFISFFMRPCVQRCDCIRWDMNIFLYESHDSELSITIFLFARSVHSTRMKCWTQLVCMEKRGDSGKVSIERDIMNRSVGPIVRFSAAWEWIFF